MLHMTIERGLGTHHACDFLLARSTLNVDDVPREEAMAILDELHFSEKFVATMATDLFAPFRGETFSSGSSTAMIDQGNGTAVID